MLAFASLQAELHRSHLGLQAFGRPLDRYLVIDRSLGPKQAADSCAFQQAFAPKAALSAQDTRQKALPSVGTLMQSTEESLWNLLQAMLLRHHVHRSGQILISWNLHVPTETAFPMRGCSWRCSTSFCMKEVRSIRHQI